MWRAATPFFVEDDDDRLVEASERALEHTAGILDLWPRPPVLAQESARLLGRVGDVQPDVLEVRVALDDLCVGDRLAIAHRSPRGSDVHEDELASELLRYKLLPVERRARDRHEAPLGGGRGWGRRLGRRGFAPTSDGEGQQGEESPHCDHRSGETSRGAERQEQVEQPGRVPAHALVAGFALHERERVGIGQEA
jgi:hypothetical protein